MNTAVTSYIVLNFMLAGFLVLASTMESVPAPPSPGGAGRFKGEKSIFF